MGGYGDVHWVGRGKRGEAGELITPWIVGASRRRLWKLYSRSRSLMTSTNNSTVIRRSTSTSPHLLPRVPQEHPFLR